MKREFLALVFVAAMTMGLAKTAGSNDWKCDNFIISCLDGTQHIGLVCGDTEDDQYSQLAVWENIHCD
ncbi:MAG: hypothetical protein GX168_07005 [Bacteroidales bacterium]|jgi:hypothetical protein|nr:hypothetical protein [Bacteroidales bacterium]